MDRSQPKYHVLIVSINSSIRLEFQSYLHKILGAHIAFDTIGLDQVQRPEQIKGYQCILFSSPLVQSEFPISIPKEVMQIICTRTFNHACLDQVSRPREPPPKSLSELYVNLSAHTAPIIQPMAVFQTSNVQTDSCPALLFPLTSIPLFSLSSDSCTFFLPSKPAVY